MTDTMATHFFVAVIRYVFESRFLPKNVFLIPQHSTWVENTRKVNEILLRSKWYDNCKRKKWSFDVYADKLKYGNHWKRIVTCTWQCGKTKDLSLQCLPFKTMLSCSAAATDGMHVLIGIEFCDLAKVST